MIPTSVTLHDSIVPLLQPVMPQSSFSAFAELGVNWYLNWKLRKEKKY